MTTWTAAGLTHFGDAQEVRITGTRADAVGDAAYHRKYGRCPGPVVSITSTLARSTTLKMVPHQSE